MQLSHRPSQTLRVEPLEGDAFISRKELLDCAPVVSNGAAAEPPLLYQVIKKLPKQPGAEILLVRHARGRSQRNRSTAALASSPRRLRYSVPISG